MSKRIKAFLALAIILVIFGIVIPGAIHYMIDDNNSMSVKKELLQNEFQKESPIAYWFASTTLFIPDLDRAVLGKIGSTRSAENIEGFSVFMIGITIFSIFINIIGAFSWASDYSIDETVNKFYSFYHIYALMLLINIVIPVIIAFTVMYFVPFQALKICVYAAFFTCTWIIGAKSDKHGVLDEPLSPFRINATFMEYINNVSKFKQTKQEYKSEYKKFLDSHDKFFQA